jgi:hypothetical protein
VNFPQADRGFNIFTLGFLGFAVKGQKIEKIQFVENKEEFCFEKKLIFLFAIKVFLQYFSNEMSKFRIT